METKIKNLILITILFLLSATLIFFFKFSYIEGAILFFGIPSLYLSLLDGRRIKKISFYSFVFMVPLVAIVDYIMHVSKIWLETASSGIRLMSTFPIEALVWGFLYMYCIISFYEYFFDENKKREPPQRHLKILIYTNIILVSFFTVLYFFQKDWLVINYFYVIILGIFFFIPLSLASWKSPHLIKKIFIQGVYFFLLSLLYELIALNLGHWSFFEEGNYIGWVSILGNKFPLEEFLWLMFAVPGAICIYEYFDDDQK